MRERFFERKVERVKRSKRRNGFLSPKDCVDDPGVIQVKIDSVCSMLCPNASFARLSAASYRFSRCEVHLLRTWGLP